MQGHENQAAGNALVRIRIHGFTTDYATDDKGNTREIDKVEYSPQGQESLSKIIAPVKTILDLEPKDPGNVLSLIAHARADAIRPAYEAWKGGTQMPVNGTPLGAWPGINSKQAEIIRHAGITSVEDLATAPESQIMRIRLPDPHSLRDMAKRFLGAKTQQSAAGHIGKLERENADLRGELDELKDMVRKLAASREHAPAKPAAVHTEATGLAALGDDELRDIAKSKGINRVGNKSRETLLAELDEIAKIEEEVAA